MKTGITDTGVKLSKGIKTQHRKGMEIMEEHSDLDITVVPLSEKQIGIKYPDGCYATLSFGQIHSTGSTLREIIDHHQFVHKEREVKRAKVILFKPSGKYYTEEEWEIPAGCILPYDMINSKDFRRIGGGAVLVDTQEPWGYPHLFPGEVAGEVE